MKHKYLVVAELEIDDNYLEYPDMSMNAQFSINTFVQQAIHTAQITQGKQRPVHKNFITVTALSVKQG